MTNGSLFTVSDGLAPIEESGPKIKKGYFKFEVVEVSTAEYEPHSVADLQLLAKLERFKTDEEVRTAALPILSELSDKEVWNLYDRKVLNWFDIQSRFKLPEDWVPESLKAKVEGVTEEVTVTA